MTGSRARVLVLCCLAQFLVVLDVSIVNVALPAMREDLGFSNAGLQWVINAYTLAFGGFLLLGGRPADCVEELKPAPGGQERLLKNILGVLNRAEDPVAVQLELPMVGVDEPAERLLVSRAGAGERSLGHAGILAWPVPFTRLTGSGPIRAEKKSPVPSGPGGV
jgi:MFS family permease